MTIKRFFQLLLLSLYSREFYSHVGFQWKNWGLAFLLRFSFLIGILTSIILFIFLLLFNPNDFTSVLEEMPTLKIINGQAEININDSNKNFIIKYPNTQTAIIAIDLDNKENSNFKNVPVVFKKDKIILNIAANNEFVILYTDLSKSENIEEINSYTIITTLSKIKAKLLGAIIFLSVPVMSIIFFVTTILNCLFYAALATLFIRFILQINTNIKQLSRLAIVASTPALIFTIPIFIIFRFAGFLNPSKISEIIFLIYFSWSISILVKEIKKIN